MPSDPTLTNPAFPRSNQYDPDWVMTHNMGPNVIWLTEFLCQKLPLKPGMRMLDLGCGKALSSIFLAKEFDVWVTAADLWVDPTDNFERIREAGMEDRVVPIKAEAHALPFAEEYFDAIVSIDAYPYFGTDRLYLNYLRLFLKPSGSLGLVMPGLSAPIKGHIPEQLTRPQDSGKMFWEAECAAFQTADWWQETLQASGQVTVTTADTMPDGWRHWADFEEALERAGKHLSTSDAQALRWDAGETIAFVRIIAQNTSECGPNLYDPELMAKLGL